MTHGVALGAGAAQLRPCNVHCYYYCRILSAHGSYNHDITRTQILISYLKNLISIDTSFPYGSILLSAGSP
jgi:hypothetical protein